MAVAVSIRIVPQIFNIPKFATCFKNLDFVSRSCKSRGMCHVVHAVKHEGAGISSADDLVKRVPDKATADAVKKIIELARRASSRREILHTDFLTPNIVNETLVALEKLADVKAVSQGGYPQAERCRLSVGHPEIMTSDPDIIAAISISGNFGFQSCSHGDFLGSILGKGIVREKLGDILLQGEKGAQVLIVPELVEYITSTLDKSYLASFIVLETTYLVEWYCLLIILAVPIHGTRVGNVGVTCTQIPLLALEYEPPKTKTFKTVEASLRIDAIASAGFKISRSKFVSMISAGDVRLNWSPLSKNGATLKTGDVVSVSGKGRLKIGEIVTTRKGKFAVELIQFL